MHEYLFDVKLFASVRINAESEEAALAWLRDNDCAAISFGFDDSGQVVSGEASMDGEADLMEVDGEAV